MNDVRAALNAVVMSSDRLTLSESLQPLIDVISNESIVDFAKISAKNVRNKCNWFVDYIGYWFVGDCYLEAFDCSRIDAYFNQLENVQRAYQLLEIGFINMGRYISEMHTNMRSRIGTRLTSSINGYLEMNITKMELANDLESLLGRKSLEDIVGDGFDFLSVALEVRQQTELILSSLKHAYNNLLTLTIPMYTRAELRNISFIKYVVRQNNSDLNTILLDLETNTTQTFDALLTYLFQGFYDVVQEIREELGSSLDDLEISTALLDEDLQAYIKDGKMDQYFFMYDNESYLLLIIIL